MGEIFERGCPPQPFGDVVFLKVKVQGGDVKYTKEILVPYKDEFTAMQRSTAFPISSVAALMAEGKFDDRKIQNRGGDMKLPLALEYKDIPFEDFKSNLEKLELQLY